MAKNTNIYLRNKIIYQVFPRQHSQTSDFKGVINDLDRIKDLGVDIVYLLPIHPIGVKNKKGSLGCPYSIKNYREVNPDLGTLDDFKTLIEEVHNRDMKIMIDVVYNHTSRDSYILENKPEWMFKNKNGEFKGKVGDWWDVTDLDYTRPELWDELIDTLCYWAKLGVDGYRCDVASMVPLEFWLKARKELLKINSEFILFAESIDLEFVKYIRDLGYEASSDCELYEAFDIEYDYDIWKKYEDYLHNRKNLNDWLLALKHQDCMYPKNYIKAHGLENHDRSRAAYHIKDEVRLRNMNALMFFLKGTTFIYAGQEACEEKLESLFDIDLTDWSTINKFHMVDLIKQCARIKKDKIFADGVFDILLSNKEIAHLTYKNDTKRIECLFNVGNVQGDEVVSIKDGTYVNIFNNKDVVVKDSKVSLDKDPIIIEVIC